MFKNSILFVLCIPFISFSQGFELEGNHTVQKVRFQLVNNLIIIPIEVNGTNLSFLLDSGVGTPILFNISDQDSIQINDVSEVEINGLGGGDPIIGLKSKGNTFKIDKILNANQNLYIVMDKEINFSSNLGIPVHGIIGYDLFKDFVVDINYSKKVIKFYNPKYYTPKLSNKHEVLPLEIENRKAYITGNVLFGNEDDINVRLLVDTGSSDALWLFEDGKHGIDIPEKSYKDFLGKGLSGNIFGKRTEVAGFRLGESLMKGPKVAFPQMENFNVLQNLGDRNGSIGGEILKRFNVVFNYPKNEIIIKKNKNYNTPFLHNMSGIELMHAGMRFISENIADSKGIVKNDKNDHTSFGNVQIIAEGKTRLSLVPEIIISTIRIGSPADEVGLQKGDLLLSVNGKSIHKYKLQEVLGLINEREGKRVRLRIARSDRDMNFSFVLKKPFK